MNLTSKVLLGVIMLSMGFAQVGLPIEGIVLVLGIDRLMDISAFSDPDAGMFKANSVLHIDPWVREQMAQVIQETRDK